MLRPRILFFLAFFALIMHSCTIQKRLYNSGWHIEWKTKHKQAENQTVSQLQEKSESEKTKVINPKTVINDELIDTDSLVSTEKSFIDKKTIESKTKEFQPSVSFVLKKKQSIKFPIESKNKTRKEMDQSVSVLIAVLVGFLLIGLFILLLCLLPTNTISDLISLVMLFLIGCFVILIYFIMVSVSFSKKKEPKKETEVKEATVIQKPKKLLTKKEKLKRNIALSFIFGAVILTSICLFLFEA